MTKYLAIVAFALAAGCAGPKPNEVPPQAAIRLEPASLSILYQLGGGMANVQYVTVTSVGVVPVIITSIDTETGPANPTPIVGLPDSPGACLHPGSPLTTPHFKVLNPGESCEIAIRPMHTGKDAVRVWSIDKLLGQIDVSIAP